MKVSNLEKLSEKIEELHYRNVSLYEMDNLNIGGFSYNVSPYSLLLDLIVFFISEYRTDGTIKFKFWQVKKNITLLVKVIRFFRALYNYFYPEDVEGYLPKYTSKAFKIEHRHAK